MLEAVRGCPDFNFGRGDSDIGMGEWNIDRSDWKIDRGDWNIGRVGAGEFSELGLRKSRRRGERYRLVHEIVR